MRLYNIHSATPVTVSRPKSTKNHTSVVYVRRTHSSTFSETNSRTTSTVAAGGTPSDPVDQEPTGINIQPTILPSRKCNSEYCSDSSQGIDDMIPPGWSSSSWNVTCSSSCSSISSRGFDGPMIFPDNVLDNTWYISLDQQKSRQNWSRKPATPTEEEQWRQLKDAPDSIFCRVEKELLTPREIERTFGLMEDASGLFSAKLPFDGTGMEDPRMDASSNHHGELHSGLPYGGRYLDLLGYKLQTEYQRGRLTGKHAHSGSME